jgi:tRNA A-37 threonylcarbamoyl transferase component Bud32
MTPTQTCPHCGDALAADSPEGLCPRCLLQSGLPEQDGTDFLHHFAAHCFQQSGMAEPEASTPATGATTPYPGSFVPPSPAELAQHFPQLEILELLGQGGMGAVYKARQRKLDRLVAVKILPPDWGKEPAFAERFAREARTLARLTHPHIVAVHDFGESDGLFYLVMEYIDGANLRHILQEGRLEPGEALAIIAQICDALQYAHEEGVVHRDIKPENILLDSKGRVKIADFGLAKLLNRPRAAFTLTGSQQVMGTLDYMAPEQRTRSQEVDHRADIYSLGVVLYEMLTGELPLGRFAPPSWKARVDARLDGVVFRALEREPERRYQRVTELKTDLESIRASAAGSPKTSRNREDTEAVDLAAVQFRVAPPAAGLIFTGLLVFIQGLAGAAFLLDTNTRGALDQAGLLEPLVVFGLTIITAIAGVLILGGVKLVLLEGPTWPLIASIWAVLPFSYAWLIGLPFGIWALLVLRKPEVRAAFQRPRKGPSPDRDRTKDFWAETVMQANLICIPFKLLDHWGLEYWGLLRFEDNNLVLEYKTGRLKPQLRENRIPIQHLHSVYLKRGWFRTVLVLHVASLKHLKGILGTGKGYLKLYLSREETRDAERLVATIRQLAPRTDAVAQPEVAALETEEHTEASALEREAHRQRVTGPIRRGLRGFLGSMYSLMVRSRVEHEVEPGTETDQAP